MHICTAKGSYFSNRKAVMAVSTRNVHDTMRLYIRISEFWLLRIIIMNADAAKSANCMYIPLSVSPPASHTNVAYTAVTGSAKRLSATLFCSLFLATTLLLLSFLLVFSYLVFFGLRAIRGLHLYPNGNICP